MLRTSMLGAILLVEGEMDVRLYRRFALPVPHTRVILCAGKPLLYQAMTILRTRGVKGVLGICDADFDRILGIPPPADVLYADRHDAEIMIAYSDALHAVLAESLEVSLDASDVTEIRDFLAEAAAKIGRIRLWNRERRCRLNFKGADSGACIDERLQLDLPGYSRQLMEVSGNSDAHIEELLEVATTYHLLAEVSELAVGHDFVGLLDAYTSVRGSAPRLGPGLIATMMRLAFDTSQFRKTSLSSSIGNWEDASGFEVLTDDARP